VRESPFLAFLGSCVCKWLFSDHCWRTDKCRYYWKQVLRVHRGPKFDPLPPPSRDSICMPSQVWSTDFLFEIFDHVINSRRIRRFGPYSNSSNTQVWSSLGLPCSQIRFFWILIFFWKFKFLILKHESWAMDYEFYWKFDTGSA